MKLITKIKGLFESNKEVECDQDDVCPIYLSYLGKYGTDSKEIKHCKNPNVHYCRKYNLVDQNQWNNATKEERMKLVEEMNLLKFIEKKNDIN